MGTNKKQTGVSWLDSKLKSNYGDMIHCAISWDELNRLLATAKQMEREQIEEAFNFGDYNIDLPDGTWEQKYKSSQQYYEENYGN